MTPKQIRAQDKATAEKIAAWKSRPLPYCVTRFDLNRQRSVPFGSKRFATPQDAAAFATRNESRFPKHGLFVDFAGFYDDRA